MAKLPHSSFCIFLPIIPASRKSVLSQPYTSTKDQLTYDRARCGTVAFPETPPNGVNKRQGQFYLLYRPHPQHGSLPPLIPVHSCPSGCYMEAMSLGGSECLRRCLRYQQRSGRIQGHQLSTGHLDIFFHATPPLDCPLKPVCSCLSRPYPFPWTSGVGAGAVTPSKEEGTGKYF